ncbi:MAG: alkaline phosphatase [Alistipes sp.]
MKRFFLLLFVGALILQNVEAKKITIYHKKANATSQKVPAPQQVFPEYSESTSSEVHNLIFMIGDGMGLGHVSMLMIEKGYQPTAFNRAQNVALISTYSANNRVTDSAAAGTALASGLKTNNGMLGETPDGKVAESMITKSIHTGHPAGIVVTCALQHATPGAFYAHVASRKEDALISRQFVESGLDVAFGGGAAAMQEVQADGKTLVDALKDKDYRVITSLDAAADIHSGRVVGLFAENHLLSMLEGRGDYLQPAVNKALEILARNAAVQQKGFVLMVEGSQIDFESHANRADGILAEMRDFDQAVAAAMDFADAHPGTLVVVTADHETGGLTMPSNQQDFTLSESGVDYRFGTKSHSGTLVPVYLYGAGAEQINGIMDNTELSKKLMKLLGLQ